MESSSGKQFIFSREILSVRNKVHIKGFKVKVKINVAGSICVIQKSCFSDRFLELTDWILFTSFKMIQSSKMSEGQTRQKSIKTLQSSIPNKYSWLFTGAEV